MPLTAPPRRRRWRDSRHRLRLTGSVISSGSGNTSGSSFICSGFGPGRHARKNDLEFGEFAGLGVGLDRSGMLLDDNVVAQRETKTRSFAGGLRRKEGIEHLFLHLGRNASAGVTDPDLHAVAKVFVPGREGGHITIPFHLPIPPRPPATTLQNQRTNT